MGPRWKIVITLLFDVLPSDSVLLLLVEVLLLLGVPLIEDEDEVVGLAVHTNGGTLTIPSPDNDPATRCVARSPVGAVRDLHCQVRVPVNTRKAQVACHF